MRRLNFEIKALSRARGAESDSTKQKDVDVLALKERFDALMTETETVS